MNIASHPQPTEVYVRLSIDFTRHRVRLRAFDQAATAIKFPHVPLCGRGGSSHCTFCC